MDSKLRVVALCCDGFYQRHLLTLLAQEHELVGIGLQVNPAARGSLSSRLKRYLNPVRAYRYVSMRRDRTRNMAQATPLLQELFHGDDGQPPAIPRDIPLTEVSNINDPAVVEMIKELKPDVVCVNGTRLLREGLLSLIPGIRFGILNLHTGLSPYSRGGNCNLFMLYEGHPELVGITIHHIDAGIDSGDIIITTRPEMDVSDNYEMIDAKCFHLGNRMMLVALRQLIEGRAVRIRQWTEGKLFLQRTGYKFDPYYHVLINRRLRKGLIKNYLANRTAIDEGIRLVGETQ